MAADAQRPLGVTVTWETLDGVEALTLRSSALAVTTLPAVGGKIISLRRIRADGGEDEVLWRHPTRRLVPPAYAGAFADYDISAFDECFPGIGEGSFPDPSWMGTLNPDHGEVWALPWQAEVGQDSVTLSVHGVRFPYLLQRSLSFVAPDRLALGYRVTNHSAVPFPYIWSAHPLFAATATTRIILPPSVRGLTIDSSVGTRLGQPYEQVGWPRTTDRAGRSVDLSTVQPGAGYGDKLYVTSPLQEGWCALYDQATGGYSGFAFDPREVAHLGLWINQDSWPAGGPTCFNVALEPCTGWPDSLTQAESRGTMRRLPPHGSHTWMVRLAAGYADSWDAVQPDQW